MNLKSLIPGLLDINMRASAAIMDVYKTFQAGDEVLKSDDSPLTRADQRSHEIIIAGLKKLTPDIPVISEEHKNLPYAERKNYTLIWCIDPLDGTKEFIKKNGEFTVNIALINEGAPVLGVMGVPAQDFACYAHQGGGAYKIQDGKSTRLLASQFSLNQSGLKLVASRSHLNEATQHFANQFDQVEFVSRGSALKFLIIAEQQADIYPRLAPTMEWDTAAAHCILEEAGGLVIRHDNREPLRYNKQNLLNPHFVAFGDVQGLSGWEEQ
jgi:3'(2'), 5'-bisphosphate nucleotidase